MSWWRRLLGLIFKPEEAESSGSSERASSKPPLVLLMSDAAGLAALRTLSFEDARSAAEYIEFWYPQRSGGTLYPFWALASEPSDGWRSESGDRAESLVLIRDEVNEQIVYPFSFTDMETALMFVRQEVNSGIAFERICVHWTVRVDVSMSKSGRATLSPNMPPTFVNESAVAEAPTLSFETKTKFVRKGDAKADEPISSSQAGEFERWIPRYPVLSQRVETLELFKPSVAEVDKQAEISPETPPEKVNGAPIAMEENGSSSDAPANEATDDRTDIEDDHEKPTPDPDGNDLPGDMGKILRWRRTERHDGPFEGFDSPRGRF